MKHDSNNKRKLFTKQVNTNKSKGGNKETSRNSLCICTIPANSFVCEKQKHPFDDSFPLNFSQRYLETISTSISKRKSKTFKFSYLITWRIHIMVLVDKKVTSTFSSCISRYEQSGHVQNEKNLHFIQRSV